MARGSPWVKKGMFVFTFLIWLCASLILSVTIWIKEDKVTSEIFSRGVYDINHHVCINVLIVVGAIILILGFLGCCGTVAENRFVLAMFFVGLLLNLVLQMLAGVLAVSFRSKAEIVLDEILFENAKFLSVTDDNAKSFQKAVAHFQEKYKCCGLIHGPDDWGNNFADNFKSCECSDKPYYCTIYDGKSVHKQPCVFSMKRVIKNRVGFLLGLAFGLSVIEMFGMVFTMILYCQIRRK